MHPKLAMLCKAVASVGTKAMTNKEINNIEELFKTREPLIHEEDGRSLIGTIEEQTARFVSLASIFKVIPRSYAQRGYNEI